MVIQLALSPRVLSCSAVGHTAAVLMSWPWVGRCPLLARRRWLTCSMLLAFRARPQIVPYAKQ
eukprot:1854235-Rhodomonas_salina.1